MFFFSNMLNSTRSKITGRQKAGSCGNLFCSRIEMIIAYFFPSVEKYGDQRKVLQFIRFVIHMHFTSNDHFFTMEQTCNLIGMQKALSCTSILTTLAIS